MDICPLCDSTAIINKRDYSFHSKKITSSVYHCNNCKEIILSDEASIEMENIYRAYKGLLLPDEMKVLRIEAKLTQNDISKKLSIGKKTYLRWEKGLSIQTKSNDKMLRAHFDEIILKQRRREAAKDWINKLKLSSQLKDGDYIYAYHSLEPVKIEEKDKIKQLLEN